MFDSALSPDFRMQLYAMFCNPGIWVSLLLKLCTSAVYGTYSALL